MRENRSGPDWGTKLAGGAYLAGEDEDEDEDEVEVEVFCPACAERGFAEDDELTQLGQAAPPRGCHRTSRD